MEESGPEVKTAQHNAYQKVAACGLFSCMAVSIILIVYAHGRQNLQPPFTSYIEVIDDSLPDDNTTAAELTAIDPKEGPGSRTKTGAKTVVSDRKKINCKEMKFVVYLCQKNQMCGEWDERQKGIISSYLLALWMKRKFVIIHENPCDLSQILIPNQYNWMGCESYILSLHKLKTYTIFSFDQPKAFNNIIQNIYSGTYSQYQVLFIRTNQIWNYRILGRTKALENIPWAVGKTADEIDKIALEQLFMPSDQLRTEIQKFIIVNGVSPAKQLICTYIQTNKMPAIPRAAKRVPDTRAIRKIFRFLEAFDKNSKYLVYLATDSKDTQDSFKNIITNGITSDVPTVDIGRYIRHPAQSERRALLMTLLEQYILSKCDLLLLTNSGFGEMAAYMSHKAQDLFYFSPTKRAVIKIRLDELRRFEELD